MTNAELAILSLVAERPRHGYEIENVIEERGMRDWTEIGFSSIYYLLKKLEKEGLVAGQLEEAARGPARKVYSATQVGHQALRAGLLDALSVPRPRRSPLQLGLANLPGIPPAQVTLALEQYHDALDRQGGVPANTMGGPAAPALLCGRHVRPQPDPDRGRKSVDRGFHGTGQKSFARTGSLTRRLCGISG